jgi:hypothetical protein
MKFHLHALILLHVTVPTIRDTFTSPPLHTSNYTECDVLIFKTPIKYLFVNEVTKGCYGTEVV